MINLTTYPNVSGTFPNVVATPNSGEDTMDGTPITDSLITDIFGFMQALMSLANKTPSGSNESASVSQLVQCLRQCFGYVGELVFLPCQFSKLTAIGFSQDAFRLLMLNGQVINRTNSKYIELDNVCYCGDSLNNTVDGFYRASNALGTTRDINGNYLVLPDYRGMFLRSYDNRTEATRSVNVVEQDAIKEHAHYLTRQEYLGESIGMAGKGYMNTGFSTGGSTDGIEITGTTPNIDANIIAHTTGPGTTYDQETRPININAIACVRY